MNVIIFGIISGIFFYLIGAFIAWDLSLEKFEHRSLLGFFWGVVISVYITITLAEKKS